MRKILAIGIISVLLGVTVTTSAATSSTQSHSIELTIESHGISGLTPTTVTFTEHQYQEFIDFFTTFTTKLEQAKSTSDALPLYKNALERLQEIGILPPMTANIVLRQLQQNIHFSTLPVTTGNGTENHNCLIAGRTSKTVVAGPLAYNLMKRARQPTGDYHFFPGILVFLTYKLCNFVPTTLDYTIGVGKMQLRPQTLPPSFYWQNYPAQGSIHTNGDNGSIIYKGDLYGQYYTQPILTHDVFYFVGIQGFNGININNHLNGIDYFIGSAQSTNISDTPPFDLSTYPRT